MLFVASVFLALCAVLTSAQTTTVYFTASTTGSYPATCTTGALTCSTNSATGGYTCNGGTVNGTHYYYPSATAFTFTSALLTGSTPILCEQYYADFQLPLTTNGTNVQFGTTSQPVCVNYRLRNTTAGYVVTADPDSVDAYPIYFNYSTTASSVPACPAAVVPSSTSAATVYFTYLGLNGTNPVASTICGAGSLSCTSYGNSQYYCPTLISGTHYQYSNTSNAFSVVSLSSEVECNGFGDGYLPLDYEGISFSGAFSSTFGCISWYGYSGATKQGYDFYTTGSVTSYTSYGGSQSFTYSTTATTAAAVCSAYIPGLSANSNQTGSSTGTYYLSSTAGFSNSTGAASNTAHFSVALLAAAAVAAIGMLL